MGLSKAADLARKIVVRYWLGGFARCILTCFAPQDRVQHPDPISNTRLSRIPHDLAPIDLAEERARRSPLRLGSMDSQSLDDVLRKDRIDFDDTFEPARRQERMGQRIGVAGTAEYQAFGSSKGTIDQLEQDRAVS